MPFHIEQIVETHPLHHAVEPGLLINVEIGYSGDTHSATISDVEGHLHLRVRGQNRLLSQGSSTADRVREMERGDVSKWRLRFLIPRSTLESLEDLRAGASATFNLEIVASGLRTPEDGSPTSPIRATSDEIFTIEQSRWVDRYLPAFGYADTRLWEVKFPTIDISDAIDRETSELDQALDHYHRGNYRAVIESCRQTVEGLKEKRLDHGFEEAIGGQLWTDAFNLCSRFLHSEAPGTATRPDAELALQITRAFHQRVANELQD